MLRKFRIRLNFVFLKVSTNWWIMLITFMIPHILLIHIKCTLKIADVNDVTAASKNDETVRKISNRLS